MPNSLHPTPLTYSTDFFIETTYDSQCNRLITTSIDFSTCLQLSDGTSEKMVCSPSSGEDQFTVTANQYNGDSCSGSVIGNRTVQEYTTAGCTENANDQESLTFACSTAAYSSGDKIGSIYLNADCKGSPVGTVRQNTGVNFCSLIPSSEHGCSPQGNTLGYSSSFKICESSSASVISGSVAALIAILALIAF